MQYKLSLNDQRLLRADAAWNDHDFGGNLPIAVNGWEYTTPGDEWTRVAYFENPNGGDSIRKVYVVRFENENSSGVEEAYISGE